MQKCKMHIATSKKTNFLADSCTGIDCGNGTCSIVDDTHKCECYYDETVCFSQKNSTMPCTDEQSRLSFLDFWEQQLNIRKGSRLNNINFPNDFESANPEKFA